jgi:response regulator RpfG family c-di-GMP phosphodiesterase
MGQVSSSQFLPAKSVGPALIGAPIHFERGRAPLGNDPRLPNTRDLLEKLGEHHPRSIDHAIETGNMVGRLAQFMRLSLDQAVRAQLVGYLHEIGKIRIPAHKLDQPLRLEQIPQFEREIFDTGLDILGTWMPTIVDDYRVAYASTPVGDGSATKVLNGETVSPGMLVRVVDRFDACTRETPWKEGMRPEAAIVEIGYDVTLHPEITLRFASMLGHVDLLGGELTTG